MTRRAQPSDGIYTFSTSMAPLEPGQINTYIHQVDQAFRHSMSSADCMSWQTFRIANATIQVRSANQRLLDRLTVAFAHLRAHEMTAPDLTINLWDSRQMTMSRPPSPWAWYRDQRSEIDEAHFKMAQIDARGELPALNTSAIRIAFHYSPNMLRALDCRRHQAYYWIEHGDELPFHEEGAPFRKILAWWFAERGLALVHAGVAGTDAGGVMFVGPSGVGKSTSTLACLAAGLRYVGDDTCLVSGGSRPIAHSLHGVAKLKGHQDLQRLPGLAPHVLNRQRLPHEKALIRLADAHTSQMATSLPLRALLIPRVTSATTVTLSPVGPREALHAIAPNSIRQFPSTGRVAMPIIADLARHLPAYELEVGPRLAAIAHTVRTLLETNV